MYMHMDVSVDVPMYLCMHMDVNVGVVIGSSVLVHHTSEFCINSADVFYFAKIKVLQST